ncbi:MAG: DEAD/DEAH box helicase family protein [Candidatus Thermoplasmatota archaeon]|jgi:Fanconi anemia group M protein|nr:DEAD/DEAH box helicase family protein [Candidatus Thermoplasmatota archaeon]MCL5984554.1 DEAD/DEAH box helicase family protein [Candidatus Thermoplasmatota archaeon]
MAGTFVEHPVIVPGSLEERAYQRTIAHHALRENLLIVLPTGLGKTAIAIRVMAQYLQEDPRRAVLFMAPTRPLVEQHARFVQETLKVPPPVVWTGVLTPGRRQVGSLEGKVVVATPQVIANDLASGSLDITQFSLIVFDEVHRATGNYPYVAIADAYRNSSAGRILGMTASPGNSLEKIREVMDALSVRPSGLEVRDGAEEDVGRYIHGVQIEQVHVDAPQNLLDAARLLRDSLDRTARALQDSGYLSSRENVTRRTLLDAGARLRSAVEGHRMRGEKIPPGIWQAVSRQSVAMKLTHAIELIETQGIDSLERYIDRMTKESKSRSPSTRMFLGDANVQLALEALRQAKSEHPKIAEAVRLVKDEILWRQGAKVILFTHYRDTADIMVHQLLALHEPQIVPARFVGQASHGKEDAGLSQKEQVRILEDFKEGRINCLVATSVAEEGLDIPATDLVIFYEPVPSEIRTIQRRGRTGRSRAGRVVLLLTRGTQDVSTHFSARGKESRMKRLIEQLKEDARGSVPRKAAGQTKLDSYAPD